LSILEEKPNTVTTEEKDVKTPTKNNENKKKDDSPERIKINKWAANKADVEWKPPESFYHARVMSEEERLALFGPRVHEPEFGGNVRY